jgi:hypothetical protein
MVPTQRVLACRIRVGAELRRINPPDYGEPQKEESDEADGRGNEMGTLLGTAHRRGSSGDLNPEHQPNG